MEQSDLAIVNRHRKVLPGPRLLHELIATTSATATAIDFLSSDGTRQRLSYDEFESLSGKLAAQIRHYLPPERSKQHIIPVIIPQSPELYVAWRAVLQAGAAFCPVSPDAPFERLNFILKDVAADLVLCLDESYSRLKEWMSLTRLAVSLETLQRQTTPLHKTSEADLPRDLEASSAAYVQYTSGSSGLPKGVKVSHSSVTQSLLAHDEHIPPFKRFLQFASPTFDVSIFEVFFPFFRGGTLVSCSRERMLADLPGSIIALDADAAELTPTVAGTLLKTRRAAPCLKVLLTIGEMLTKSVVSEFGGSDGKASMLYAMYGPTEAAIHCTVAPRFPASDTVRNIGLPLSTVTAFILKEDVSAQEPAIAFRGEVGELAVAGQLADGYLNRQEQNDAAFIELPDYGQIYRTGDRAVCHSDQHLEILGRMSAGQVKLRGQRVELGEIEEVACKTAGLSLAVASVIDEVLVLFCVQESNLTIAGVKETCKAWLPAYMRPGEIIILEEGVPRLPSGKVDKKQLESDYQNRKKTAKSESETFNTELERIVAIALQDVLACNLTKGTNLRSCGMDSLRAIRLASKLRGDLPQISVNMLLESENMADLVAFLSQYQESGIDVSESQAPYLPQNWNEIANQAREMLGSTQAPKLSSVLPCSSIQTAMLTETSADPKLNFNSITVKRAPGVSRDDLWQALCRLAQSNELLRSGFLYTSTPSMPFVQVVWDSLQRHDLSLLHPLQLEPDPPLSDTSTLRIHHALYDGWSWELILDDLNGIIDGERPRPRPSFQDFAMHQAHEQSSKSQRGLEYWGKLEVGTCTSTLPDLTPRYSQQYEKATVLRELDLSYNRLSALSEDLRVSRQALLQSCWALLLSVYTYSEEFVFGSVISGRHASLQDVDQIIGPCLSTLPMKIDLHAVNTYKDLVSAVHRQNVRSLDYSHIPLRGIINHIGRKHHRKLFDTLFVWQQGETRPPEKRRYFKTASTEDVLDYTAVIEVEPVRNRIQARLTVDLCSIPIKQAKLLLDQLNALLVFMVDSLDQSIQRSYQWQGADSAILSISNPKYQGHDRNFDLFSTVAEISAQDPERPAIKFVIDFDPQSRASRTEITTYSMLYSKATGMASRLTRQCNINLDDLICVIATKSTDLYIAILATVMTGAGYMCIDPKTPTDRIKQILQQANCSAVLTDQSVNLRAICEQPVLIRDLLKEDRNVERFEPRGSQGRCLAYCVWTSGTTGQPKGILVTRHNLLSNLAHLSTVYQCQPKTDSLLQACSPAFDVSVFEIFWTWHMGMTLCSASNDVLFRDIEMLIDGMKITHLSMTPSVAALVNPDNVPTVKMLVTAGEPMNSKVFDSWAGRSLYQGYGPSETTNICNVRPKLQQNDVTNNVGPAFPNTSIFVCCRASASDSRAGQPVALSLKAFQLLPKGAVGEIWIGGDQVARGYIDSGLTASSFLRHPQYGRLYKSGDIGRLLSDDSLVILGRDDDQAKIRGQRIELGEINGALVKAATVKDAATVLHKSDNGDRLVSFCCMKSTEDKNSTVSTIATLFQDLESLLPVYMIPNAIVPMTALPLTRQGKIDKNALSQHYGTLPIVELESYSHYNHGDGQDDLMDEAEIEIATALSVAADVSMHLIKRNTSFYALGLDSINSIRLIQLLNKRGFRPVDVSTVLRHASVKQLKSILNSRKNSQEPKKGRDPREFFKEQAASSIISDLKAKGLKVDHILPCTDLQLSMLSNGGSSDSAAYRNTLSLLVEGDLPKLRRAWETIKLRQPLLRTVFVNVDAKAMPYAQVVLQDVLLPWHDHQSPVCESCPAQRTSQTDLPYSLSAEKGQNGSVMLRLEIHHALYDAEAMSTLLNQVQAAYHEDELQPVTSFARYLDYMINLNEKTTGAFWSRLLSGVLPCRLHEVLPATRPQHNLTTHARVVSRATTEDLDSFAHSHSTTILATIQCALARLLSYYLETRDICFGNVYSGRTLPIESIEQMIGPCFNTLPVRTHIKATSSNKDLIQHFQELNIDILPQQPSSPRRIQRLHSKDGMPLFDILLLIQQDPPPLDARIWKFVEDSGEMSFPFILEVLPSRTSNKVKLTLHSQATDETTLARILEDFDKLLLHSLKFPQARAQDFSSISNNAAALRLRPRLKEPNRASPHESMAHESLSEMEHYIQQLLLQFVEVDRASITGQTTIFQLGLDSINAVQIAAKLREAGHQITSATILEFPSVAEMAAACSAPGAPSQKSEGTFDLEAFDLSHRKQILRHHSITPTEVESVRPCTPTQCGILAEYLRSSGKLYHNSVHLKLDTDIDRERLLESWEMAMGRHEMLRTGFVESDDGKYPFVMITYKAGVLKLPLANGVRQGDVHELARPAWHLSMTFDGRVFTLVVSMLHALYDAQSMDAILADVSCIYQGVNLPAPESIAPTIATILARSDHEDSKRFWEQEEHLAQPTKFPDLNIYSNQASASFVIVKETSLSLQEHKRRCAELGCSLQTVCQTAWALVLAAYTGQQRVTFGLILSGRDFGDARDDAIFPCINIVPTTIEVGRSRNEVLRKTSKLNGGLVQHQYTPLTSIKRWQSIETELFDTVLVVQKFESKQPKNGLWQLANDEASAEYALSLEILPDEDSDTVRLQATYSEKVIPAEAAKIILEQVNNTLCRTLNGEASSACVTDQHLSFLPPKDVLIPAEVCFLHELVESTAAAQPDATALEFVTGILRHSTRKSSWTYSELVVQGNKIANLLVQNGARTGDLVAVCFDKCPEASFAILGVLKAGCAYVALDPGAPQDRKAFILKDAGCQIVLTTVDKVEDLREIGNGEVLAVDQVDLLHQASQEPPILSRALKAKDTCYCLYTSGTTGRPKGCLISHESAVQAMMSFQRIFRGHWTAKSRWLQFASFHFDVSVLEQYWSWSVGMCVTSAPRDLMLEDLPGFIRAVGITHLDLTPSLARLLMPEEVPSLCEGVFIVGGEQVSQDIIETWGHAGCLYNFYGPSEVTIGCTVHPRVRNGAKPTNIGQQWDNVGSFVLEPGSQTPVMRGAVGELCLSGVLVGKGYLSRPDLTKDKFVVLEDFDTRVYRTGDLVRFLHDNSFEFLGRSDDQVKLRGQRLELGEINQIIWDAAKEVKGVATLIIEHPAQGKEQLIAFFSTSSPQRKVEKPELLVEQEATNLSMDIRRRCMDKLPGYMVPTSILMVSSIPLSANNKVDNRVLKQLYMSSQPTSAEDQNPFKFSEEDKRVFKNICVTLEEFLQLPKGSVKPSSKLFELGIDSISALGFSRKLKAAGLELADVATIMRHSLVADLAHVLNQQAEAGQSVRDDAEQAKRKIEAFAKKHSRPVRDVLGIRNEDIEHIAPCTPLQEGMISSSMKDRGPDSAYFLQLHLDLSKDVNPKKMRAVWREVQISTSILRTFFVPTEDGFAQVVLDPSAVTTPVDVIDGSWHKTMFEKWVEDTGGFGDAVPWQIKITHNWNKAYMSLFIFHGLYDGVSLPLILERVAMAYNGGILQPSHFHQVLAHGPLLQRADARTFWSKKLSGVQSLDLQRSPKLIPSGNPTCSMRRTISLSNQKRLCLDLNVTEPALFQAAWLLVLQERYGISPIIGVVVSGRSISFEGAETLVGPMLNTLPSAIIGLSSNANIETLIKACHELGVDILPYQHTALRDIAKWIDHGPRRGLFDSLFVFQKEQTSSFEHKLWTSKAAESMPDYPLNIEIERKLNGSFTLTLVVKPEYVGFDDMYAILNKLEAILQKINDEADIILPEAFTTDRPGYSNSQVEAEKAPELRMTGQNHAVWTSVAERVREQIATLCSANLDSIHLHKPSIFELGLDSIDAMKLATRLKNAGLRIPVSRIMQAGTVAGIAAMVSEIAQVDHRSNTETDKASPATQARYRELLVTRGMDLSDVQLILPVTPMQEGLLLDVKKYYNVMSFELEQKTGISRLSSAWKQLVQRQPILRTRFIEVDDLNGSSGFLQIVKTPSENFEVEELRNLTLDRATSTLKDPSESIQAMPMLRVCLLTQSDGKRYMITAMPHAAYDAWSLQLLHLEVAMLYHNLNEDSNYSDEFHDEQIISILEQISSADAREFWESSLRDLQPTVMEMEETVDTLPAQLQQRRSRMQLSRVQKFCKEEGVTLQSLGLACWSLLLAHHTRKLSVCFGLVLSGRTTEGSDRFTFPTFNTVIFNSPIDVSESGQQFVRRVHGLALSISEHQHFPLREAAKIVRSEGARTPELFNTLFTYQKGPVEVNELRKLYHEVEVSGQVPNPPYAVNVEMEGRSEDLRWTIATQESMASLDAVNNMLEQLDAVLQSIVQDPGRRVCEKQRNDVSICGLPLVELAGPLKIASTGAEDDATIAQSEEWNSLEKDIRQVLAEVSNTDVSKIGKTTSFYQLGLDSISAIKVTSLLKKKGIRLPVSKFVEAQDVERMAHSARNIDTSDSSSQQTQSTLHQGENHVEEYAEVLKSHGIDIDKVDEVMPATSGQICMLEVYKWSQGRLSYPTFWLDVVGATKARLESAMKQLKEYMPMLRTRFLEPSDGSLVQIVVKITAMKEYDFPWTYEINHQGNQLLLSWKLHHALYDAVSLQVMLSELEKLCSDAALAPANTNLRSFHVTIGEFDDDAKETRRSFWTTYLASDSIEASHLQRGSFSALRVEKFVPRALPVSSVNTTLRSNSISIQSLLFAACARAYARLLPSFGSRKYVMLGVYVSNRSLDIADLPGLAGPTFSIVPLRINVAAGVGLVEAAKEVQRDVAEISKAEHCGVSLRQVYEWMGRKVDCVVNFLRVPENMPDEEGLVSDGKARIRHARLEAVSEHVGRDLQAPSPFFAGGRASGEMEWLLPTIDVEAKVEDGYLGVGVFAPGDMLDVAGVDGLIEEIRDLMGDAA